MADNNVLIKVYAGRFQFSLPDVMRETSNYSSMYRTSLSVQPLPYGGVETMVQQRIEELRTKGFPVKTAGAAEPISGMRSIWSQENTTFPDIMTLESIGELKKSVFIAHSEADAGKEALAESLVRDLFQSYVPGAISGFSLGDGAIQLEPSQNEQIRRIFKHRIHSDIEIDFETRTVSKPDKKSYADLDEDRQIARIKSLSKRKRVAAHLKGGELWISASGTSEPALVRFTWDYPGEPYSATKPSVAIMGTAELKHQAELEAIWEAVLGSLDSIPLAPPETHAARIMTEAEAIDMARDATRGVKMPSGIVPQTQSVGDLLIVTFPIRHPKNTLGPDYYVQVSIDRRTRKIKETLIGS